MKTGIKYIIWGLMVLVSLYAFNIDGLTRTQYIGVSMPIEIVVIVCASVLLIVSLTISNRIFLWFNWILLLGSTMPLGAFVLLVNFGAILGYTLLVVMYAFALFFITRWKLKSTHVLTKP